MTDAFHSAISAYDLHYPHVCWSAWGCMMQAIPDVKPRIFVFGGDQFNNECISRHTKSKPYYRPRAAYLREQQGFAKSILEPLEKALPKGCEKVWVIGNHDDWEFQLVEEQPELEGLIDRVAALHLRERGWQIIPLGGTYRHGKLSFCHGEWLTGIGNQAGIYPAKKLVDILATNAVAGHTHAAQSFARISPISQTQRWMGWISPILGNTNPAYMKNRPNAWVNGFNVTDFWDGGFAHTQVVVSGGKCAVRGRLYKG